MPPKIIQTIGTVSIITPMLISSAMADVAVAETRMPVNRGIYKLSSLDESTISALRPELIPAKPSISALGLRLQEIRNRALYNGMSMKRPEEIYALIDASRG